MSPKSTVNWIKIIYVRSLLHKILLQKHINKNIFLQEMAKDTFQWRII